MLTGWGVEGLLQRIEADGRLPFLLVHSPRLNWDADLLDAILDGSMGRYQSDVDPV